MERSSDSLANARAKAVNPYRSRGPCRVSRQEIYRSRVPEGFSEIGRLIRHSLANADPKIAWGIHLADASTLVTISGLDRSGRRGIRSGPFENFG